MCNSWGHAALGLSPVVARSPHVVVKCHTILQVVHYTGTCYLMVNQLNHHFCWAVVRTCVAASCNKTSHAGVVNSHKFTKEIKDSRVLPVSMLWLSVLFDRLLSPSGARHSANSLNYLLTQIRYYGKSLRTGLHLFIYTEFT